MVLWFSGVVFSGLGLWVLWVLLWWWWEWVGSGGRDDDGGVDEVGLGSGVEFRSEDVVDAGNVDVVEDGVGGIAGVETATAKPFSIISNLSFSFKHTVAFSFPLPAFISASYS